MLPQNATLKIVLLAGGESRRMQSDKALLPLPDGSLLYQKLYTALKEAFPRSQGLYVSLHGDEKTRRAGLVFDADVSILYDESSVDIGRIGPAAGLLAAYHSDPSALWVVLACDYPLMTSHELNHLRVGYKGPVTCFENVKGFIEPLVGIWGPEALRRLEENVLNGRLGPSQAVRDCQGKTICPLSQESLTNVNTKEEWARAVHQLLLSTQPR